MCRRVSQSALEGVASKGADDLRKLVSEKEKEVKERNKELINLRQMTAHVEAQRDESRMRAEDAEQELKKLSEAQGGVCICV